MIIKILLKSCIYHYEDVNYQKMCYPLVEKDVDIHPVIFNAVEEAAKNPEEEGTDD